MASNHPVNHDDEYHNVDKVQKSVAADVKLGHKKESTPATLNYTEMENFKEKKAEVGDLKLKSLDHSLKLPVAKYKLAHSNSDIMKGRIRVPDVMISKESAFTRQVVKRGSVGSTKSRIPQYMSPHNHASNSLLTSNKASSNSNSVLNSSLENTGVVLSGEKFIEKALKSKLYLLQQPGPNTFLIGGDAPGNKCRVIVGPQSCTCGVKSTSHCIHVLFVMLRVFQISSTSALLWKKPLHNYEVETLFRKYHERRQHKINDSRRKMSGSSSSSLCSVAENGRNEQDLADSGPVVTSTVKFKDVYVLKEKDMSCTEEVKSSNISPNEDRDTSESSDESQKEEETNECSICLLEMFDGDNLAQCKHGCHNQLHQQCINIWFEECTRQKETLMCPLCRAAWSSALDTDGGEQQIEGQGFQAATAASAAAADESFSMNSVPLEHKTSAENWAQVFGEEIAVRLFSRSWSRREQALRNLEQKVITDLLLVDETGADPLLEPCFSIISLLILDPVYKVFVASLRTLRTVLSFISSSEDQISKLKTSMNQVISSLLYKCADPNRRTGGLAMSALEEIMKGQEGELAIGKERENSCNIGFGSLDYLLSSMLKYSGSPDSATCNQSVLGRLFMLERLISCSTVQQYLTVPQSCSDVCECAQYHRLTKILLFTITYFSHSHSKISQGSKRVFYHAAKLQAHSALIMQNVCSILNPVDPGIKSYMCRKLFAAVAEHQSSTSPKGCTVSAEGRPTACTEENGNAVIEFCNAKENHITSYGCVNDRTQCEVFDECDNSGTRSEYRDSNANKSNGFTDCVDKKQNLEVADRRMSVDLDEELNESGDLDEDCFDDVDGLPSAMHGVSISERETVLNDRDREREVNDALTVSVLSAQDSNKSVTSDAAGKIKCNVQIPSKDLGELHEKCAVEDTVRLQSDVTNFPITESTSDMCMALVARASNMCMALTACVSDTTEEDVNQAQCCFDTVDTNMCDLTADQVVAQSSEAKAKEIKVRDEEGASSAADISESMNVDEVDDVSAHFKMKHKSLIKAFPVDNKSVVETVGEMKDANVVQYPSRKPQQLENISEHDDNHTESMECDEPQCCEYSFEETLPSGTGNKNIDASKRKAFYVECDVYDDTSEQRRDDSNIAQSNRACESVSADTPATGRCGVMHRSASAVSRVKAGAGGFSMSRSMSEMTQDSGTSLSRLSSNTSEYDSMSDSRLLSSRASLFSLTGDFSDLDRYIGSPGSDGEGNVSFKTELAATVADNSSASSSDNSSDNVLDCHCKEEVEREEAEALAVALERSSLAQDCLPHVPGLSRDSSEVTLTIHCQDDEPEEVLSDNCMDKRRYQENLDWKKGKILGTGGFCSCFQARDIKTGTLMAVKQMFFKFSRFSNYLFNETASRDGVYSIGFMICYLRNTEEEQAKVITTVQEEVNMMAKLNHPNILRILGATKHGAHFFMFLEWMPGSSVAGLLEMYGAFSDETVTNYTQQLLRGVAHLHEHQIVHRDIKGANLLIDSTGQRLRICDFGTAARLASKLTVMGELQGQFLGTIAFMAPEVLRGSHYGRSCDVWSIGCTIIQMITTKFVWGADQVSNHLALIFKIASTETAPPIPDNMNPAIRDLSLRCLEVKPEDRPSIRDLLKHPLFTMKR